MVRMQSITDCRGKGEVEAKGKVEVKDALTVAETAERLGISEGLVYAGIHQGWLWAVRLGARRWAIPRKALESLLDGTWQPPHGEDGSHGRQ